MNLDTFVISVIFFQVVGCFPRDKPNDFSSNRIYESEIFHKHRSFRKTGVAGGTNVTIDQIRYIGVLENKILNTTLGSVIILGKKWVLTAAFNLHFISDPKEVTVRVGSTYAGQDGELIDVEQFYPHPKYNYDGSDFDYNIALLKLAQKLKFTKQIHRIHICAKLPEEGEDVTVSGYGYSTPAYETKGFLVEATVPILDYKNCAQHYHTYNVTEFNICTSKENVGPCHLDYGSPLVYRRKLIGVYVMSYQCGSTIYPPVYMNVAKFKHWIISTVLHSD